jgi:hypothetical protein
MERFLAPEEMEELEESATRRMVKRPLGSSPETFGCLCFVWRRLIQEVVRFRAAAQSLTKPGTFTCKLATQVRMPADQIGMRYREMRFACERGLNILIKGVS